MNLITNAAESIDREKGSITLATGMMDVDHVYLMGTYGDSTLVSGKYVYLEVSDTGCGMDKHTQKKIFDPFFTTKFSGRGLGMSAMLGIVSGHGGAIRIYSEVGEGTTFKIIFPLSSEDEELHGGKEVGDGVFKTSGTVLIVDDDSIVRETVASMLEDMGFDVITANDGKEGVDVYCEQKNDITFVLLDMTMPMMDGKECFRELRKINADAQVILSSGYNEQEATSRFVGKGLAGFIQKPYTSQVLEEKIKEVVQIIES